jgi:hypothetical protein
MTPSCLHGHSISASLLLDYQFFLVKGDFMDKTHHLNILMDDILKKVRSFNERYPHRQIDLVEFEQARSSGDPDRIKQAAMNCLAACEAQLAGKIITFFP